MKNKSAQSNSHGEKDLPILINQEMNNGTTTART